jgi:putative membrane protein
MNWFLVVAAALHALFMLGELFPWDTPFVLRRVSEKERAKLPEEVRKTLPEGELFTKDQKPLVATIVHNAGIYNGIIAGGLFWAASAGASATDVARVLLTGAIVAGVFGTVTLKSPLIAVQALVGVLGLLRL